MLPLSSRSDPIRHFRLLMSEQSVVVCCVKRLNFALPNFSYLSQITLLLLIIMRCNSSSGVAYRGAFNCWHPTPGHTRLILLRTIHPSPAPPLIRASTEV